VAFEEAFELGARQRPVVVRIRLVEQLIRRRPARRAAVIAALPILPTLSALATLLRGTPALLRLSRQRDPAARRKCHHQRHSSHR
jgi:hypothetical protein